MSKSRSSPLWDPFTSRSKAARRTRAIIVPILTVAAYIGATALHFLGFLWKRFIAMCVHIYRWQKARKAAKVGTKSSATTRAAELRFRPVPVNKIRAVTFDDIYGCDAAKELITNALVVPFQKPKVAAAYTVGKRRGIILIGPPGNGKTMLAMATAHTVGLPFFHLKPAEVFSNMGAATEKGIADFFACVSHFAAKAGGAVICIDELERVAGTRNGAKSSVRQVGTGELLTQMDGVETDRGLRLLIIGCTNNLRMVSKAVQDRLPSHIEVPMIDAAGRAFVLERALSGNPVDPDLSTGSVVDKTEGFSGRLITSMVAIAAEKAMARSQEGDVGLPINMADFEFALSTMKGAADEAA